MVRSLPEELASRSTRILFMKKQISHPDDGRKRDRLPIVIHIGHFDHVGVLEKLAEKWDVPIYAHDTRSALSGLHKASCYKT
jgi:hypothetical protein